MHASSRLIRIVLSAVCLSLCLVLPFFTGQIPEIGSMLCPMHIPVLLCGFLCGPGWAALVGIVAPLLRFALFGMPPIFPVGVAMCFELAAYGAVAGLMHEHLPRRPACLYLSLGTAMVLGRIAWGAVRVLLTGVTGSAFTWAAFLAGAFTNAVPGIILQLVLVPVIVLAMEKALPELTRKK